MELREFAGRVLFATTLEEKLAGPGEPVTDEAPGVPLAVPEAPGRPDGLRLGRKEERPGRRRTVRGIRDDGQRAVLLHGFANHELLAAELMALVLLKFPDAPAEFRAGLFRTLREEQRHTRMYLGRLRECGVTFGEFAVNRYFWDAVAPVESPLDYVARLSLTFEQANLDYAKHYAGEFAEAGDARTAEVLRTVYRDEIGHVAYGLAWFRRWREAGRSDWEAYRERLVFPLSPSRAKANGAAPFNREGRAQAGLDEDFVRRIELFERSKGRTPRVAWFCPGAEASAATGRTGETALEHSVGVGLELLMAFLVRRDDVLLVRREPSLEHVETLRRAGFVLPELEALGPDGGLARDSLLRGRKLGGLQPWAWCPAAVELLGPLRSGLPSGAPGPEASWRPGFRELFSKGTHQRWLAEFLAEDGVPGAEAGACGHVVTTEGDLVRAAERFRRLGFPVLRLKACYGTAGRGQRRWEAGDAGAETLAWARNRLGDPGTGGLVVEPCLPRMFDFSVQYEMGAGGLRTVAFVRLENTPQGAFRAARCGPKPTRGLEPALARFLHERVFPVHEGELREFLERRLAAAGYLGPVGVDAFVYRTRDNGLAWKPVVEVNPRHTMGRVAHELRERVAPGRAVRLEITRRRAGEGAENWSTEPGTGRLAEGSLWWTETREGEIGARISIENTDNQ
jgi:uncharacterized ferritin-like protein (DUF455 family)